MTSSSLPPLRGVINRYGISSRKNLGQNFILDLNLTGKIARSSGSLKGIKVIEVGAGPGGLTRSLLEEGAEHVIAIECDQRAITALKDIEEHYAPRLTIIAGDAMKQNYEQLARGRARIISNLPYNIGTALLTGWLTGTTWPPFFDEMVLLLQKEVAERIVSPPGRKNYGRLSVLAQWRCDTKILFHIPRTAFTPPPKVDSALVSLTPRAAPVPCQCSFLEQITAITFGQRRKMLRSSLKQVFADTSSYLESLGLDPLARPETLTVEEFCTLARAIQEQRGKN